ncbi:pheromone A receptor-domain-containing protein [Xylariaceae sp. FL1272]|nr:pheromone A receptor-domain-containing protein [Xylariaceae sp. FL1272]
MPATSIFEAVPGTASVTNNDTSLVLNMVFRVLFAFVGIVLCWVPFRLLLRNGEFAAVVLIVDVAILNLITIVNSLIWRNDDYNTWYNGFGLCDLEVYIYSPLQTIYATSIFAVMVRLAQSVKGTAMHVDRQDRIKRNLYQAAIIFPVPIVQLVFTYFDLAQRFIIGTLVGCSAVYDDSWPKVVFFDILPAVYAVLSVPFVVLLFSRFYKFTKTIRGIVQSHSQASLKTNNTRRRLYNLSFAILAAYVPLMAYLAVVNVQSTVHSYKPYDFHRIRYSAAPYPWDSVLFVPSWMIPDLVLNQAWLNIATALAIFLVFGTTYDALDIYRKYAGTIKLDEAWNKFLLCTKLGGRRPLLFGEDEDLKADPKKGDKHVTIEEHPPQHRRSRSTVQSQGSQLSYAATDTSIKPLDSRKPPVIPPRRSSLRSALPALPRRVHLSSLPSITGSISRGLRSFSDTSSAILRGTNSANDIPMLPLHRRTHANPYNQLDDSSPRLPPFNGDSFFSSSVTRDFSSPRTPNPNRLTLGPDFYNSSFDYENNAIVTVGPRVGEVTVNVPIIRSPSFIHESQHLSQLAHESTRIPGSSTWASMSSTLSDILSRVGVTR